MSKDYLDIMRKRRLKETTVQRYEGFSISSLESKYTNGETDLDKLNDIVHALQSVEDYTFDGLIEEEDFRVIAHFLTDKYWLSYKNKKDE